MNYSKTITKALLISSLFLFAPTQVSANDDNIVTCYEEHIDLEYKLDRSSIYQKDKNHVAVMIYKYQDGELVSRAVYQYQYKDNVWAVFVHDSNLPDVIRVNKKGKVETITANLSWIRADIFPELDAIRRVALSYAEEK